MTHSTTAQLAQVIKMRRELSRLLYLLKKPDLQCRQGFLDELLDLIVKAERVYARTGDSKLFELLEEAGRIIEGEAEKNMDTTRFKGDTHT